MRSIARTGAMLVSAVVGCVAFAAQEGVVPDPAAVAAAAAAPEETADVFQGEEAERFLSRARITRVQSIPQGVTAPRRVTLELDGVTRSAAFKTIHEERRGLTQLTTGQVEVNFVDTWRTEIAAYVVDRIIGLGLVPATVERSVRGEPGSMQWWVVSEMAEVERRRNNIRPPDTEAWNRQQLKMELFDNLIFNTDRHMNNILVTKAFDLRLIDHSRSFRDFRDLRPNHTLTRFSRSLLEGLARLEREDLRRRIGRYVSVSQIDTMLRRRDRILELAARLVAERGEAAVLYP